MPPTTSKPPASTQALLVCADSKADSVPNSATSVKVRNPALALGVRSRSRPMSRPMARLMAKVGRESRPPLLMSAGLI